MKIDPSTTVRNLVAALPSSKALLKRLGISNGPPDERTLEQACTQAQVPIEEFLDKLDDIDWNSETGRRESSDFSF